MREPGKEPHRKGGRDRQTDQRRLGGVIYLEDLHLAGLGDGAHDLVAAVAVLAGAVDVVPVVRVAAESEREILVHAEHTVS